MGITIKNWLSWYAIIRDGKRVQERIENWRTALKQARKWSIDIFEQPRRVEILNCYTGEIITLEEAENRYKKWLLKHNGQRQ